jgi:hypothetical protein
MLGVTHVLAKMAREVSARVKDVQLVSEDRALAPVELHVRFKGTRPDERAVQVQIWKLIDGQWYLVGHKKPGGKPGGPGEARPPKPPMPARRGAPARPPGGAR